jgi:pilus assembly protein Flp/PilA
MRPSFATFTHDESGATAIEYGLIASMIALVIISAVTAVGGKLTNTFNEVSSNLTWSRSSRVRLATGRFSDASLPDVAAKFGSFHGTLSKPQRLQHRVHPVVLCGVCGRSDSLRMKARLTALRRVDCASRRAPPLRHEAASERNWGGRDAFTRQDFGKSSEVSTENIPFHDPNVVGDEEVIDKGRLSVGEMQGVARRQLVGSVAVAILVVAVAALTAMRPASRDATFPPAHRVTFIQQPAFMTPPGRHAAAAKYELEVP